MKKLIILILFTSCGDINGDLFGDILEEPLEHARHFTQATLNTRAYTDEDNAILYPYVDMFVEDAKRYGLDFSYVYDGRIILKFASNIPTVNHPSGAGGTAYGGLDDDSIIIYISKPTFDRQSAFKIKMLMYHELGHDIFGSGHYGNGIMHSKVWRLEEENEEELIKELFENY